MAEHCVWEEYQEYQEPDGTMTDQWTFYYTDGAEKVVKKRQRK